ncbi:conserved hypothetical protein [Desulfamplus magnetovallimortis]|uniref:Uncharacterized protein n=1 Tax=Desulfamplus magnetovallimortis TaxID=1246637 RepID=A0A1W1HBQ7_9BACT|nr:hypothetical protein [Desulfamplus magnetovallimortis]SLM29873.1 conserved hypothetical protein [Desulfamplus magnetovallimortis]
MNVKEAVKKAIEYIADIFESENLENIGLEEVALDEKADTWEVTVGFSRPWDHEKGGLISNIQRLKRDYKIVCIDNKTEEVKSIKIREVSNA